MCEIDWSLGIQLLSAIASIIIALVAIFPDYFKYSLFTPNLKIVDHNLKGEYAPDEKQLYYHLKVINSNSFRIANNCKVVIREITKISENGDMKKTPVLVDSSFFWSPGPTTTMLMDISEEQVFDFIVVNPKTNTIYPLLIFKPQNLDGNIYPNQKTTYALQVIAKGYKSKMQYYEMVWDGKMSNDPDIMSKHLSIKEVKNLI